MRHFLKTQTAIALLVTVNCGAFCSCSRGGGGTDVTFAGKPINEWIEQTRAGSPEKRKRALFALRGFLWATEVKKQLLPKIAGAIEVCLSDPDSVVSREAEEAYSELITRRRRSRAELSLGKSPPPGQWQTRDGFRLRLKDVQWLAWGKAGDTVYVMREGEDEEANLNSDRWVLQFVAEVENLRKDRSGVDVDFELVDGAGDGIASSRPSPEAVGVSSIGDHSIVFRLKRGDGAQLPVLFPSFGIEEASRLQGKPVYIVSSCHGAAWKIASLDTAQAIEPR